MIFLDITLYIFICIVFIQVVFYLGFFSRFSFYKQPTLKKSKPYPVSVIICAKNESKNLKTCLPLFTNQDYENYQIVLINDDSHDDTLDVMESFASLHSNIKIVNVKSNEAFWGNKKYALTLGIKAAKHNLLLFSDADCKPLSKHWISEMTAQFDTKTSIILGYGAYNKIKNSFLNKLLRFETLTTAISYFSYAKLGIPYMGVGRNLAYTKTEFFNARGFMGHMNILSGDDDLFVNQAATKNNTAICFSKDSFTTSSPETNFKNWYRQKRRHISTAKHYKPIHKYLLALFYTTNIIFWISASTLLIATYNWALVLSLVLLRIIIQYIIYGISAKKLKEMDILLLLPLLEIFLITIQLAIFINNLIAKPNHWK